MGIVFGVFIIFYERYMEQQERLQVEVGVQVEVAVVRPAPRRVVRMNADVLPIDLIVEEVSDVTSDSSTDSLSDSSDTDDDLEESLIRNRFMPNRRGINPFQQGPFQRIFFKNIIIVNI